MGSGIVLDARGYITNNEVVENADSITVQFHDGSQRTACLVGSDRYTDIAMIQVDHLGSARTARLGDSDSLRVGRWVVAIGSPRGLDWTVTAGIVSATHRAGVSQTAPEGLEDFVQTDTPINPGNSGGPLLNLRYVLRSCLFAYLALMIRIADLVSVFAITTSFRLIVSPIRTQRRSPCECSGSGIATD